MKLSSAISDIFGASGQLMMEALVEGKATPEQIAQLAQKKAKRKIPEILAALEGHRMNDHHRMMLTFSLDHLKFLEEQIVKIDQEIMRKIEIEGWKEKWAAVQSRPAVGAQSAAALLAETGVELSARPRMAITGCGRR